MRTVIKAPAVDLSLASLDPDGVRRIQGWFDYLARWDEDEAVRKNSIPLPGHAGIYVLRTTTDIRIFFRIEGDTITVLDVARQAAIVASGGGHVGGSAAIPLIPVKTKGE